MRLWLWAARRVDRHHRGRWFKYAKGHHQDRYIGVAPRYCLYGCGGKLRRTSPSKSEDGDGWNKWLKGHHRRKHFRPGETLAQAKRNEHVFRTFGLTTTQFDALVEAQRGRCAICGRTEPQKGRTRLVVDHSHVTGKVHGLLCSACNAALGSFQESTEVLMAAIRYLELTGG